MDREPFIYQYSAKRNAEIADIREKYLPHEEEKIVRLRRLDRRVQSAGVIPALAIGVVGSLVFGLGMCFGLDVFAGGILPAVLLCALGFITMLPAYPVYRHIAKKTRGALVPEILRLSEEIVGDGVTASPEKKQD